MWWQVSNKLALYSYSVKNDGYLLLLYNITKEDVEFLELTLLVHKKPVVCNWQRIVVEGRTLF